MDKDKQRIAIAEACGWKCGPKDGYKWVVTDPDSIEIFWSATEDAGRRAASCLPDYQNDLNAMHMAERVCLLSKGTDYSRWEEYDNRLFALCGGFARAHATAAQRAEAFLRTLNLWTE